MVSLFSILVRLSAPAAWVLGGALWALSPLGIHLSQLKYKSPEVFWKLFPSAPLLLGLGFLLHYLSRDGLGGFGKLAAGVALLGALLVTAGDLGLFYLHLDDLYIRTAPAWFTLRLGLILLCAGSMLFGVGAARRGVAPVWGVLPFSITSLGGLIAVLGDQGSFGATLWAAFGLGWAWLGLLLFVEYVLAVLRARNARNGHAASSKSLQHVPRR